MTEIESGTNWEDSKENVQPLRSGRKASFLKAALQPSAEVNQHLIEQRQKFEEEILAGENSFDPLDSWDKYLKWTQQNFLIGENKKTYEAILRKFIVKFLKFEQYKNDPRYINAWILMARNSENPEDIFSYMKSEGLGLKCATFYISWAEELEKYGLDKKAASIYQLGQENNAEPIALLSKMQNAFEMRSARRAIVRINQKSQESPDKTHDQTSADHERKAFKCVGRKKALPFSSSVSQNSFTPLTTSSNSSLIIFSDKENSTSENADGKWAKMPDHYEANKENSNQKPSLWSKSSVQQSSRLSTRSATSSATLFSIFEDISSESSVPQTPARKVSKNVEKVLAESKRTNMVEQPLELMLSECNEENNPKIVRRYPFDKIYSVMGEFQLEEIIAASRRKNNRAHNSNEETKT